MEETTRKTGIAALGEAPWGTHFCLFHQTKEDLIDILTPYFRTGLENNELCMWVFSDLLCVEEAKQSLESTLPDLDNYVAEGRIELLNHRQWYTQSGKFEADRVLRAWVEKEAEALRRGFDGLRVAGDVAWLAEGNWREFMDYETAVDDVIGQHRMLTVCAYPLAQCGASEIVDAVSRHGYALVKRRDKMEVVEGAQRRLARETLRRREERFRMLAENASDITLILDGEGRIQYGSPEIERLLAYEPPDLLGKSVFEFVHPDDAPNAVAVFQRGLQEPFVNLRVECRVRHKDGSWRFVEGVGRNLLSAPAVQGVVVNCRDTTARTRAKAALLRLETAVDQAIEGVVIADLEGRIEFVNPAWARMHGWAPDELAGKHFSVFHTPQQMHSDVIPFIEEVRKIGWKQGRAGHARKDGTTFVAWMVATLLKDEKGTPVGHVAMAVDVTEHKQNEVALRESEARYRRIVETALEGIWGMDERFCITFVNQQMAEMLGLRADEMLGKPTEAFMPEEEQADFRSRAARRMRGASERYERRLRHKDGRILTTLVSATPVFDEDGRFRGSFSMVTDITERKRSEQALRESQQLLEKTFASLDDAVFLIDAEGTKIVDCNPAASKIFGYGRDEMLERSTAFLHVDEASLEEFRRNLCAALKEGNYLSHFVFRMKRKNGSVFPTEHSVSPFYDDHESHIGWVSVMRDITSRKQAEETVRESEEWLRCVFEGSRDAVFIAGADARFVDANAAASELTGYSWEELRSMSIPDLHEPADRHAFETYFDRILAGEAITSEAKIRRKDGVKVDAEFSNRRVVIRGVSYVHIMARDVSDRRRAERMLRESEERYRALFELAAGSIVLIDAQTGELAEFNRQAHESLGYTREEFKGLQIPDFEALESAQGVAEHIERILRQGEDDFETKHRTKSGETREIHVSCKVIPLGGKKFIQAIFLDVTEAKEAEQKLRARLREIDCLHKISMVAEEPGISLEEILRRIVTLIPSAWQYPEIACARISLGEQDFRTDNFKQTQWRQTSAIRVHGGGDGSLDVCYLERPPKRNEGPFLAEERKLLNTIAEYLGRIIESWRAAEALHDSREQLRALAIRFAELDEAERRQLAGELHDEVGQTLAVLGIDLNLVRNELPPESASRIGARLDDALRLVEQATVRVRGIMSELRPAVLDDYGLMAALRWFGEQYARRTGIAVKIHGRELTPRLSPEAETAAFRIAQEALTNAVKHAQARRVRVTLEETAAAARLTIADDGVGFDPSIAREPNEQSGWGLLIMRERAAAVGGTVRVKSEPLKGTRVIVEIGR